MIQLRPATACGGRVPTGQDLPGVTLSFNTSEGHKQVAEAIQAMWQQELGITVELENQEWKVFLANAEQMNFQISRMGWIGDYADPYTFLELLTSDCGNNHSNWSSKTYEPLLNKPINKIIQKSDSKY